MWTDAEIVDFYDSHLNVTLSELAALSGRSVAYCKALLMGGN